MLLTTSYKLYLMLSHRLTNVTLATLKRRVANVWTFFKAMKFDIILILAEYVFLLVSVLGVGLRWQN
jgi:hypothetical protein